MKNRWYDCEAGQVIRMLESDGEKGLSAKEARVRLKEDGKKRHSSRGARSRAGIPCAGAFRSGDHPAFGDGNAGVGF